MSESINFLNDFKVNHDNRNVANRIFFRGNEHRIKKAEDFLKAVVDSCDFCMCMSFDDLEKALKDDEIKEVSETNSSSTNGGLEVRREAILNLYNLDSTKYTSKEMPKYGIMVGKDRAKDLIVDPDIFYHYGAAMIVFKKENLIDRTTMTVGSSLTFQESLLKTPTFVTDPKFICIKGLPKKPEMMLRGYFMGLNYFVDYVLGEKGLKADYPNSMAMLSDDMLGFENFELQMFGKLTFSKDVKEICYMNLTGKEQERAEKMTPLLRKFNLTCEELF